MELSEEAKRYRDELKALAENIPFKEVEHPKPDTEPFVPKQVRQERTYARYDPKMQAAGRFLMERGKVDILKPEQTLDLFIEIHWCANQLRGLSRSWGQSAEEWREWVVQGRRLVSQMEAAEEELFIANRRLVVRCVKPFFWIGQVWLSDFFQEGSKALSNAIRKFDYARGTPFFAYAQKAIQNRLRNYFRDHVRSGSIEIRPTQDMTLVKNATESWVKEHGSEPDVEVLAKLTGLPRSRIGQVINFLRQWERVPTPPISLDAMLGDSSATLHDLVEDMDADVASESAQISEIWKAIERLPERSRYIMRLRFIEGRTLEETGMKLNLTRARIKQIQDDSLRKLREMLQEGMHRNR